MCDGNSDWSVDSASKAVKELYTGKAPFTKECITACRTLGIARRKPPCTLAPVNKEMWHAVKSRLDKLQQEVELIDTSRRLTESEYISLLHYVVGLLYTELPPRRNLEYATLLYTDRDAEARKGNWLDPGYLYIKTFKSLKRDGTHALPVADMSQRLFKAIQLYAKHHPLKHESLVNGRLFLVNYSGEGFLKVNSITRLLQRAIGFSSMQLRQGWFDRFT
jgi:hypothetical protein